MHCLNCVASWGVLMIVYGCLRCILLIWKTWLGNFLSLLIIILSCLFYCVFLFHWFCSFSSVLSLPCISFSLLATMFFLVVSITNCYSVTYPGGMEGWVGLSTMSVNSLMKLITQHTKTHLMPRQRRRSRRALAAQLLYSNPPSASVTSKTICLDYSWDPYLNNLLGCYQSIFSLAYLSAWFSQFDHIAAAYLVAVLLLLLLIVLMLTCI